MEVFANKTTESVTPIHERPKEQRLLEIQRGNDDLRQSLPTYRPENARIFVTSGVHEFAQPQKILEAVKGFDDFRPGDDPYRQHDFGALTVGGVRYYFKIDYYQDANCHLGVDPFEAEPFRVLTIMRADEY